MDTRIKKVGQVSSCRGENKRKAKESQEMEFIILYLQLSTKSLSAEGSGFPDGHLHSLLSTCRARKFPALFI